MIGLSKSLIQLSLLLDEYFILGLRLHELLLSFCLFQRLGLVDKALKFLNEEQDMALQAKILLIQIHQAPTII